MFYCIVCLGLLTQISIKHLTEIKYSPAGWGTHGCHAADCNTQRNPNSHLDIYRSQPLDFDLRVTSIQCEVLLLYWSPQLMLGVNSYSVEERHYYSLPMMKYDKGP